MILRSYQARCIEVTYQNFYRHFSSLIVLPTGSGKTVIFSGLVGKCKERMPEFKCLILVHKNILIRQTVDKLADFGIRAGIYSAGEGRKDLNYDITVGSVQSVVNEPNIPKFHLLIIDECHRAKLDGDSRYSKILARLRVLNEKLKVLGCTATPFDRYGAYIYGKDKFWSDPVYTIPIEDMTKMGHLCPLRMVGMKSDIEINLNQVKKSSGDFVLYHLSEVIMNNKDKIHAQVEDAIKKTYLRNKILWLTTSIEHAEYVHSLLGDNAAIVHSRQNSTITFRNFYSFTDGDAKHLVSVLIASEGFDHPPADALVMMRPTRSKVLYTQAVGRILRPHKSKEDGLFLDYGFIVENLGHVYNVVGRNRNQDNDMKLCPQCDTYNPKRAERCSECSNRFMNMCPDHLEQYPYGERCPECEKEAKKKLDGIKGLSLESYEGNPNGIRTISKINYVKHISKAGNECMKIVYFSGMSWIIDEYIMPFKFKQFVKDRTHFDEVPKTVDELLEKRQYFKHPSALLISHDDKWPCVQQLFYSEDTDSSDT